MAVSQCDYCGKYYIVNKNEYCLSCGAVLPLENSSKTNEEQAVYLKEVSEYAKKIYKQEKRKPFKILFGIWVSIGIVFSIFFLGIFMVVIYLFSR